MDERGIEDAAILLLSLGSEAAAEAFRRLTPREVQSIGEAMTRVRGVPGDRVDSIMQRFADEAADQGTLVRDNGAFVRDALQKALGPARAGMMLERIEEPAPLPALETLRWLESAAVADMLRDEHPQIIASALMLIEREQAAVVLRAFDEDLRNEVVMRAATLEAISPQALVELDAALARKLATGTVRRRTGLGGVKPVAELLNLLGAPLQGEIIEAIRLSDDELATLVADQLFTFDELVSLDDKAIQAVLREIQTDTLVTALKAADEALREKIFKNMSARAAETLREDLDSKGPVRLTEVELQQKEVMKVVRRLADEGQIQLGAGGGADAVV